jgi:hypothetical protein
MRRHSRVEEYVQVAITHDALALMLYRHYRNQVILVAFGHRISGASGHLLRDICLTPRNDFESTGASTYEYHARPCAEHVEKPSTHSSLRELRMLTYPCPLMRNFDKSKHIATGTDPLVLVLLGRPNQLLVLGWQPRWG